MTKTTFTISGRTFTSVTVQGRSIKSVTYNHQSHVLTVSYASEMEHVDPADDWAWWDLLMANYICG